MNEMVKRTWTTLDGRLIFDVIISCNPGDGVPSVARIVCKMGPEEEHIVKIHESRSTPFRIGFHSGLQVEGELQQRAHVHIDGVDSVGIFADIRFGTTRLSGETHFEGLMVACPSRGGHAPWPPAPAPPDPPAPLPPPHDDPTEPGSPLPILSGQPGELFSYVYVRRWPRVTDEDRARR
ncbi:hypothetical protein [Sorangium atrum]|uniref:PPC domain-containing protein n=1 Tax=Sorangium atrum TaxID=2995308 RepID=A0ABT5CEQ9_9BACT|nr:hypothetical protein [Sorangium aterium]MDC0684917.1 hypothetical protein [Sorangium aterium]